MGGRRSVTTTFRKVERVKPRKAARRVVADLLIPSTSNRSPLTAYIEENLSSGLSIHELVEQFQEYDCDHRFVLAASYPSPTEPYHIIACEICALHETKKGRGSSRGQV